MSPKDSNSGSPESSDKQKTKASQEDIADLLKELDLLATSVGDETKLIKLARVTDGIIGLKNIDIDGDGDFDVSDYDSRTEKEKLKKILSKMHSVKSIYSWTIAMQKEVKKRKQKNSTKEDAEKASSNAEKAGNQAKDSGKDVNEIDDSTSDKMESENQERTLTENKAVGETEKANKTAKTAGAGKITDLNTSTGEKGDTAKREGEKLEGTTQKLSDKIHENRKEISTLIGNLEAKTGQLQKLIDSDNFSIKKTKEKITELEEEISAIKTRLVQAKTLTNTLGKYYQEVTDKYKKVKRSYEEQIQIAQLKITQSKESTEKSTKTLQGKVTQMMSDAKKIKDSLNTPESQKAYDSLSNTVRRTLDDGNISSEKSYLGMVDSEFESIEEAYEDFKKETSEELSVNQAFLDGKLQYAKDLHSKYSIHTNTLLIEEMGSLILEHKNKSKLKRGIEKVSILQKIESRKEQIGKNIISNLYDEAKEVYQMYEGKEEKSAQIKSLYRVITDMKGNLFDKGIKGFRNEITPKEIEEFNSEVDKLKSEFKKDTGEKGDLQEDFQERKGKFLKQVSTFYDTHQQKLLGKGKQNFMRLLIGHGGMNLKDLHKSEKRLGIIEKILSARENAGAEGIGREDQKSLNELLTKVLASNSLSPEEVENLLGSFAKNSTSAKTEASIIAEEKFRDLWGFKGKTGELIQKYSDDINMMKLIKETSDRDHIFTLLTYAEENKMLGKVSIDSWFGEIAHSIEYSEKDSLEEKFGYLKSFGSKSKKNERDIAKMLIVNKDSHLNSTNYQAAAELARYAYENNLSGHEIIAQSIRKILKGGGTTISNVLEGEDKEVERTKKLFAKLGIDEVTGKQRLFVKGDRSSPSYILYNKGGKDFAITMKEMEAKIKSGEVFEKSTLGALLQGYHLIEKKAPEPIITQVQQTFTDDKSRGYMLNFAIDEKGLDVIMKEYLGSVKASEISILGHIKSGNLKKVAEYVTEENAEATRKLIFQNDLIKQELLALVKNNGSPEAKKIIELLNLGVLLDEEDQERVLDTTKVEKSLDAAIKTCIKSTKKHLPDEMAKQDVQHIKEKIQEIVNESTNSLQKIQDYLVGIHGLKAGTVEYKQLIDLIESKIQNKEEFASIVLSAAAKEESKLNSYDQSNLDSWGQKQIKEKAKDLKNIQIDAKDTIATSQGEVTRIDALKKVYIDAHKNGEKADESEVSKILTSEEVVETLTHIEQKKKDDIEAIKNGAGLRVANENKTTSQSRQATSILKLSLEHPELISPQSDVVKQAEKTMGKVIKEVTRGTTNLPFLARKSIQEYKKIVSSQPDETLSKKQKEIKANLNKYDFTQPHIPYKMDITPTDINHITTNIPEGSSIIYYGEPYKVIHGENGGILYSLENTESASEIIYRGEGGETHKIDMEDNERNKIGSSLEGIKNIVNFQKMFHDLNIGELWQHREGIMQILGNKEGSTFSLGKDYLSKSETVTFLSAILKMTGFKAPSTKYLPHFLHKFKKINFATGLNKIEDADIDGNSTVGSRFMNLYFKPKGYLDKEKLSSGIQFGLPGNIIDSLPNNQA